MTRKDIIEVAGALALLVGAAVAYGRFSARMDDMDRRITALEKTAQPGTRLGDLCLDLIDQQAHAKDSKTLQEQLERFHCYDRVAASTSAVENATGSADLNAVANANDAVPNPTTAVQNR
jgi:hypothetical protein